MRKKNQPISVPTESTREKYIPGAMSITTLATDCTFLSASYLFEIDGQEKGVNYDMSSEDSSGNIFNQDWDYGTE